MSYKCQNCGKQQPPKTPQHSVIVDQRDVINIVGEMEIPGVEITKEIKVCPPCYKVLVPPTPFGEVVIKPSDIRKAERAARKRIEREDEEAEDE